MEIKKTESQNMNGKFGPEQVEPVLEKVLASLDGVPAGLAGMAIVAALVEVSRLEAEAEGVESFDGFHLDCKVKGFDVTIRVERKLGGLAGLLQSLFGEAGIPAELEEAMQAAMARKDDPESDDYCDCPACNSRRQMMAEDAEEEERASRKH